MRPASALGACGTAWSSIVDDGVGNVRRDVSGTRGGRDETALTADDLFDLASLTKVVVALAVMVQVERGILDLDAPVRAVMPVGRGADADRITLRHLLTHTAGLPASTQAWREGMTGDELLDHALRLHLHAEPGRRHEYSCIGFIAAGRILEMVGSAPLDGILRDLVVVPAGATSLAFGPVRPARAVATEYRPGSGLVQGGVHDELAAAIGRPVGNAGLFGTAEDVARVVASLRTDARRPASAIVSAATAREMAALHVRADGYGQGLCLRRAQARWMGPGTRLVGHTGFTGTAFALDTATGASAVLLTNGVYPHRGDPAVLAGLRRSFFTRAFG